MVKDHQDAFDVSAHNLFVNCAGCRPGDRVLIIYETENDGYYDNLLVHDLELAVQRLGMQSFTHGVPLQRTVDELAPDLCTKMASVDCTLFLARLGDQIRFRPGGDTKRQIVSYALDRDMFTSEFCRTPYNAFDQLNRLLNDAISKARDIHVTCPLGTDFAGGTPRFASTGADTTRKRFPVSVSAPIPATTFRGQIAQSGFLTGTGSHYYTPYCCALDDTLIVKFDGHRITGFDGSAKDVNAARRHYEFVGGTYGIDTYYVHSWHAGIHPGLRYTGFAGDNTERWSGGAFGNPRVLHFHTCGAYPPGEISLNVVDPTVKLDGVAVWENGRLFPERVAGGAKLLRAFPDMADVFANPCDGIGLAPDGRLRLNPVSCAQISTLSEAIQETA